MTNVMVTSEYTVWAKFILRLIIAYKMLNREQHEVNPVKETVDIKCCVFKVSKYIKVCC